MGKKLHLCDLPPTPCPLPPMHSAHLLAAFPSPALRMLLTARLSVAPLSTGPLRQAAGISALTTRQLTAAGTPPPCWRLPRVS